MIVLDTEGTDLIKPDVAPLADQPHLVEFAGIKLDNASLKETGRLHFLCNPGVPLPELFTKITGITEAMVADKKPFAAHYHSLAQFFLGEDTMVAHNMGYDEGILKYTMLRLGKLLFFPWPIKHICTVEASAGIKNHRLGMAELHLMAAGKENTDRIAFAAGQLVKHKSLGKCTIQEVKGDKLLVKPEKDESKGHKGGKPRLLDASMFKGAAFEGAHGAMKDVEELVTCVRWLRKEGHL
jgi:hypothetical protein